MISQSKLLFRSGMFQMGPEQPPKAAPGAHPPATPTPGAATLHLVEFKTTARCSCGWTFTGRRLDAELRASVHDIDHSFTFVSDGVENEDRTQLV